MTVRPCRLCGRELHFMESPNGNMIPFEQARELYVKKYLLNKPIAVRADPNEPVYQPHLGRCPKEEKEKK